MQPFRLLSRYLSCAETRINADIYDAHSLDRQASRCSFAVPQHRSLKIGVKNRFFFFFTRFTYSLHDPKIVKKKKRHKNCSC